MLPSEINDAQLLKEIKEKNSSEAITELANRHSGIYLNTVSQYTYVPLFERQELIDHKLLNIYNYALDYDPNRNTKFSTYVGQRIKWQCQSLVSRHFPEMQEITENIQDEQIVPFEAETEELSEFVESKIFSCDDKRFRKLFKLRNPKRGKRKTWAECGGILGFSHEWCRKLYKRNVKNLNTRIEKENK